MKRFLLMGMGVVVAVAAVFALQAPLHHAYADAASQNAVCQGVGTATGGSGCSDTGGKSLSGIIQTLTNLLSAIVGIAAVIMIIIAGMRYITSGGDSSKISGAKSALIYAIVGLIIVAMAQLIVEFVIKKAS